MYMPCTPWRSALSGLARRPAPEGRPDADWRRPGRCAAQAVNQQSAAPAAAPGAPTLEGSHSATKVDLDQAAQAQVPMPDLADDDDEAAAAAAESPDLAAHQEERLRDLVRPPLPCPSLKPSCSSALRLFQIPSLKAYTDSKLLRLTRFLSKRLPFCHSRLFSSM